MKLRTHYIYWVLILQLLWLRLWPETYNFLWIVLLYAIGFFVSYKVDKANAKIKELVDDAKKDNQLPATWAIKNEGTYSIDDRIVLVCPIETCREHLPIPIVVSTYREGVQIIDAKADVADVWAHVYMHEAKGEV